MDIIIVACSIYDLNLVVNLIIKTQIPHSEKFLNIYSLVALRKIIKFSHMLFLGNYKLYKIVCASKRRKILKVTVLNANLEGMI